MVKRIGWVAGVLVVLFALSLFSFAGTRDGDKMLGGDVTKVLSACDDLLALRVSNKGGSAEMISPGDSMPYINATTRGNEFDRPAINGYFIYRNVGMGAQYYMPTVRKGRTFPTRQMVKFDIIPNGSLAIIIRGSEFILSERRSACDMTKYVVKINKQIRSNSKNIYKADGFSGVSYEFDRSYFKVSGTTYDDTQIFRARPPLTPGFYKFELAHSYDRLPRGEIFFEVR